MVPAILQESLQAAKQHSYINMVRNLENKKHNLIHQDDERKNLYSSF